MATTCVARPAAVDVGESVYRRQKILRSATGECRWAEIEKLDVQFQSQPEVRIAGTYPHSLSPASVGVVRNQKRYSPNYHNGFQSQHTANSKSCLATQSASRVCILSPLAFHRILAHVLESTNTPLPPCISLYALSTLTLSMPSAIHYCISSFHQTISY